MSEVKVQYSDAKLGTGYNTRNFIRCPLYHERCVSCNRLDYRNSRNTIHLRNSLFIRLIYIVQRIATFSAFNW